MSDQAEVIRVSGHFEDWELAAVASSFVGVDADQICQVAMVVVIHPARGEHELRVATTITDDAPAVARILRHAADHCHGGCTPCRRRNRKGGNHANK